MTSFVAVLLFSTYLGGSDRELGFGIGMDVGGNTYVAGRTESPDFPTANALQPALAGCGTLPTGL